MARVACPAAARRFWASGVFTEDHYEGKLARCHCVLDEDPSRALRRVKEAALLETAALVLGKRPRRQGSVSSAVRVSLSISPGLPHRYARVHAAVVRVVGWAALRRTPTSRPALEPSWSARERFDAYDVLCRCVRVVASVFMPLASYFARVH